MKTSLIRKKPVTFISVAVVCLGFGVWTATSFIRLASSETTPSSSAEELQPLPELPPQEAASQQVPNTNREPQQVENVPVDDNDLLPPPPPLPDDANPSTQQTPTNVQTPGTATTTQVSGQPTNPGKLASEVESFLVPYIYDVEGRRDPFKRYLPPGARVVEEDTKTEGEASEAQVVASVQPLQRFALEDIQLVGIMWDVEAPRAMFIAGNRMHILGKDERIGRNDGYIAAIREGEVVIVESARVRDQVSYNTRVMKLPR